MADFEGNLVSYADDVGIIQKRIIQNLYDNPIVVCDVSGKNPNVMFELGMRIAFDKPVVIIKDEKTPFSFDTSHIKHLEYPSDLRFQVIEQFIEDLANLILETVHASKQKDYKTFLKHKHFSELQISEISFCEHPVNSWRASLTEMIFDGYPKEFLIDKGYIPFANWSDWGMLCFDTNKNQNDKNYPIVLWDHELADEVQYQYEDFYDMIEKIDQENR